MFLLCAKSESILSLDEKEDSSLPASLKTYLFEIASRKEEDSENVHYYFKNYDEACNCGERIRKYLKNRETAERRNMAEYTLSSGIYEKSDILKILEIQNYKCYFSGEPISESPKNYSIDHLKPVCDGGSSWPGNLALVIREINQKKHSRTKAEFWRYLAQEKGAEWVNNRKEICKIIDKERKILDRARKKSVRDTLSKIEAEIARILSEQDVRLGLVSDELVMEVDKIKVIFPLGILRKKSKFADASYFLRIAYALVEREANIAT